jgi:3-dehydroquinate synthase class II
MLLLLCSSQVLMADGSTTKYLCEVKPGDQVRSAIS